MRRLKVEPGKPVARRQAKPSRSEEEAPTRLPSSLSVLQTTIGNRAVARLMTRSLETQGSMLRSKSPATVQRTPGGVDSREQEDLVSGVAGPAVAAPAQIGDGEGSEPAPEGLLNEPGLAGPALIATAPEAEGNQAGPAAPVEKPANEALSGLWRLAVTKNVKKASAALKQKKPDAKGALASLNDAAEGIVEVEASYLGRKGKTELMDQVFQQDLLLGIDISQLEPHAGVEHPIDEIAETLDWSVPDLEELGRKLT